MSKYARKDCRDNYPHCKNCSSNTGNKCPDFSENKFNVEIMDYVRVKVGDRTVESTVMWNEKRLFYLNPLFGSNVTINECDEVEILKKFAVCDEEG